MYTLYLICYINIEKLNAQNGVQNVSDAMRGKANHYIFNGVFVIVYEYVYVVYNSRIRDYIHKYIRRINRDYYHRRYLGSRCLLSLPFLFERVGRSVDSVVSL